MKPRKCPHCGGVAERYVTKVLFPGSVCFVCWNPDCNEVVVNVEWTGADWRDALREAAERREFPNWSYAHKWFQTLDRGGYFTRHWDDLKGE